MASMPNSKANMPNKQGMRPAGQEFDMLGLWHRVNNFYMPWETKQKKSGDSLYFDIHFTEVVS